MSILDKVRRGFSPYSMLMKNQYFKRMINKRDSGIPSLAEAAPSLSALNSDILRTLQKRGLPEPELYAGY